MLKHELKKRNLPILKSREKMIEIMQREVYGYLPENNFAISVSNEKIIENRFDRGNVHLSVVDFTITNKNGSHTFPLHRLLHTDGKKRPVIIYIGIHSTVANIYFPIEELSESEFDILTFGYKDVTSDDDDFTTGIAPLIFPNGRQNNTDCGKIGLWAFSAMRVLDYTLTLPGTDEKNVAILGHSRLGKAALFTGMMDTRFAFTLSNNAGCGGEAIARGGSGLADADGNFTVEKPYRGETIDQITTVFPYWFCENYKKYAVQGFGTDFDQHYILASIAPRNVCVNSSELDYWADQKSQQLSCLAASEAWEKAGLKPLQECDHFLTSGEKLLHGDIGIFMTPTKHYLSRYAWNSYMEFMRIHRHN